MKAYHKRIGASKERMEQVMRDAAKRFGHHGPDNLVEVLRQRDGIAIDRAHAAELCRTLAGWKG